jgi:flagellar hook-length control protein FliK
LAAANATALTNATTSVAISALGQSAPVATADSKSEKSVSGAGQGVAAVSPDATAAASAAAQASSAGSPAHAANNPSSQVSTSGTSYSQSGYGTGGTDAARFVQRVANAFQALGNQSGPLKLRLSPPELGSLQVEVRVDGGQLTAHLQAETPEARSMLLDNLPTLRDRLEQQDIKVARFDVDLMGQSSGGLPNTPNRDAWAGYNTQTGGANRTAATTTATASQGAETGPQALIGNSQLNVVI